MFFEPTLRFSLRLLQLNSRDEAGRFWPLGSEENAASLEQTRSIPWSKYAYSVILVPGEGPEVPNVPLSKAPVSRAQKARGTSLRILRSWGPVLESIHRQYGRVKPFELLLETTDLNGSAPLSRVIAMRVAP